MQLWIGNCHLSYQQSINMTIDFSDLDQSMWRPQARFQATIGSHQQLNDFNHSGGVAVFLDVMRAHRPDIKITGTQSRMLSLWETRSTSGFVTKPKFSAGLLTVRFVSTGQISYLTRSGQVIASPSIATLTGFDDLREVHALSSIDTISATVAVEQLVSANVALTGEKFIGLGSLEPLAEMTRPGIRALFGTIQIVLGRLQGLERPTDLTLPLIQEIIIYQLLSAWPRRDASNAPKPSESTSRQLNLAIEYIDANISKILTLADVASAARTGVRSLQTKFKIEFGLTPFQFIIKRRLMRAHEELLSSQKNDRSVAEIARSYGFVHMSDFGQRYRRMYGYSPSQTKYYTNANFKKSL